MLDRKMEFRVLCTNDIMGRNSGSIKSYRIQNSSVFQSTEHQQQSQVSYVQAKVL